jgi:hemolysin III
MEKHDYLVSGNKKFNEINDIESLVIAKNDNRLFKEYPLYSEGLHKPYFRGVLHLICAIFIIPFGFILLFMNSKSIISQSASIIYCSCNIFCYGISGLYHVFRWLPQTEILLQKLDHCGIAILSVGTMVPVSFLLLPREQGILLITISTVLCIILCYRIFQLSPSLPFQAIVAIWWIFPFFISLYQVFNTIEFTCMLLCILCQACGVMIFTSKSPNLIINYIEYHEVFHIFVVLAGLFVYICNFSIISRSPY